MSGGSCKGEEFGSENWAKEGGEGPEADCVRAVREDVTPTGERGERSEEMVGSQEEACTSEAEGPGEERSVTVLAGIKGGAADRSWELYSVSCWRIVLCVSGRVGIAGGGGEWG